MKTKSSRSLRLATAVLVGALGSVTSADAQTPAKEGRYDYTACWSGVSNLIAFSKTHTAFSYEMMGNIRSNLADSIFDKNTFRCVGMNASFDGKTTGSAACESIDRDGDKRMSYFSIASDGKVTRDTVAGTGKFDGMSTTTTVAPLGPFPIIKPGTFQDCNQQSGTYKLK